MPTTPNWLSEQSEKQKTKTELVWAIEVKKRRKSEFSADAFTKHLTICEIEWNNTANVEEVKSIDAGESVEATRLMHRNEVFCLLFSHNNIRHPSAAATHSYVIADNLVSGWCSSMNVDGLQSER